jgi:tripartite-type tricarboxylate transporter receptor subunit TctC
MKMRPGKALFIEALLTCLFLTFLTEAFSQTPFYQGKTITVVVGIAPGGSGDTRIKALLPFLRKYIPGNPTLVIEHMPGAGGEKGSKSSVRERASGRANPRRAGCHRHTTRGP